MKRARSRNVTNTSMMDQTALSVQQQEYAPTRYNLYHDLLATYYFTLMIIHPIWKGQVYRKTSR